MHIKQFQGHTRNKKGKHNHDKSTQCNRKLVLEPTFPFSSSCYKNEWEQGERGVGGLPVGVAAAGMRPLLAFTPKASSAFSSVTSCSHYSDLFGTSLQPAHVSQGNTDIYESMLPMFEHKLRAKGQ